MAMTPSRPVLCMAAVALLTGVAGGAQAWSDLDAETHRRLDVSIGAIGILNDLSHHFRAGIEYRWQPEGRWTPAPGLGFSFSQTGANFLFGSLHEELWRSADWSIGISAGAGSFHGGNGLKLGDQLEFQTGFEVTRTFARGTRIGIAGYHISNGGLSHVNPGTEALMLVLGVPIGAEPGGGPHTAAL